MDTKKAILEDLGEVKRNLILLLSSKSNEPVKGKLWYQKELFLLSKNIPELEEEAGFEPYFWGPHSELADSEMEDLVQLGVVRHTVGTGYVLTKLGQDIASSVCKDSKDNEALIEDVKDFLNSLSKDELLLYIYASYPETAEDAVEIKNLLPKRKDIAIALYKKDKVSVGKASEIAGVSVNSMIRELQSKGIYKVEE